MQSLNSAPLPLIAIVGPTASGKTGRAVSLALQLQAEVVSADSRQVYRGMTIGSGKDLADYEPLRALPNIDTTSPVPGAHLIDICPAGYKYNLHEYLRDYYRAEKEIRARGNNVLLCGGTGMYAEAVLSGMHLPEVPENKPLRENLRVVPLEELHRLLAQMKSLHNTTDVDTHARAVRALEIEYYYREHPEAAAQADRSRAVRPESVILLIDIPREQRRRRISERLNQRMKQGMAEEIESLLNSGIAAEDLMYYGLEYKLLLSMSRGSLVAMKCSGSLRLLSTSLPSDR